jgi:hypothetical protein
MKRFDDKNDGRNPSPRKPGPRSKVQITKPKGRPVGPKPKTGGTGSSGSVSPRRPNGARPAPARPKPEGSGPSRFIKPARPAPRPSGPRTGSGKPAPKPMPKGTSTGSLKKPSEPKKSTPRQPQPKSLKALRVSVNKKSQAGDLGEERAVMRQAARRNREIRRRDEQAGNLGFGLINMTYRGRDGKLKNSVMNRNEAKDTKLGSSNYYFLRNNSKKKK